MSGNSKKDASNGLEGIIPDIVTQLKSAIMPTLQNFIKEQVGQTGSADNQASVHYSHGGKPQGVASTSSDYPSGQPDEGTISEPPLIKNWGAGLKYY
jgi:hypothetical protein